MGLRVSQTRVSTDRLWWVWGYLRQGLVLIDCDGFEGISDKGYLDYDGFEGFSDKGYLDYDGF